VLCRRCEVMVGQTGAIATAKAGGRRTVFGVHRFRHLTCERCGLVLPTVDDTESLLDKLTQLAQFGLTAEGRPLLESSHDD
jgi:hypothetical protein